MRTAGFQQCRRGGPAARAGPPKTGPPGRLARGGAARQKRLRGRLWKSSGGSYRVTIV